MDLIHILLMSVACCIQLIYHNRVQIIDADWEKVPHEEALEIYEQILKGDIEVYER